MDFQIGNLNLDSVNSTYNCGYSLDFISDLQDQVSHALSRVINRQLSSKKFDLQIPYNEEIYLKLSHYQDILKKMTHCQNCFGNITSSQIISTIKNNINKL